MQTSLLLCIFYFMIYIEIEVYISTYVDCVLRTLMEHKYTHGHKLILTYHALITRIGLLVHVKLSCT